MENKTYSADFFCFKVGEKVFTAVVHSDNISNNTVKEFIKYSIECNYAKYEWMALWLDERIAKKIIVKNESVFLLPYWAFDYCRNDGVEKELFTKLRKAFEQILIYIITGNVGINVYGDDKLTEEYKIIKTYDPSTGKERRRSCALYHESVPPGQIYVCCACNKKPVLILEKKIDIRMPMM